MSCTIEETGRAFKWQEWYICEDCSPNENTGCCKGCAEVCHKGHKLSEPKRSKFFCDCGAGDLKNPCSLYEYVEPEPIEHGGFGFDVDPHLQPSADWMYIIDHIKLTEMVDNAGKIEAHSFDTERKYLSSGIKSGFVAAVEKAYSNHYPLKLSPSHFLLLITQGIAHHINDDPEKYRKHFVDHEGKEKLIVQMNDWDIDLPEGSYDWSKIFKFFADELKKKVKANIHDVVIDDFTCTTPTSLICSQIALMDSMKAFFEYGGSCCGCGVVRVILEGEPEDWQKLKDKVQLLVDMNEDDRLDLNWWLRHLVPVVDKICEAGIDHTVDKNFWRKIYDRRTGSGMDHSTGWITVFFPYIGHIGFEYDPVTCTGVEIPGDKKLRQKFLEPEPEPEPGLLDRAKAFVGLAAPENEKEPVEEEEKYGWISTDHFPKSISEAPFTLLYMKKFEKEFEMRFNAGFFGYIQHSDGVIEPNLGWVVSFDEENPYPF